MNSRDDELVRKKDLQETEARIFARITGVEEKIDGVDERLSAKIDGVDKRLSAKIDDVDKRLSAKIDGVDERLSAKIDDVSKHLSAKIEANAAKIDENRVKIEANAAAIHNLTREVVDIRHRLDQTLTRDEFKVYFDEIITGQDEMMKILTRLDQERTSVLARIERLERRIEGG